MKNSRLATAFITTIAISGLAMLGDSVLTRKNMPQAATIASDPEGCIASRWLLCSKMAATPEAKTRVLALNSIFTG